MHRTASAVQQSSTARGEPRWFFGGLVHVRASAADTGGQYTLLDVTMPANMVSPLHVHYTEDEGFYVLEGSVTIDVGGESLTLGPGQHGFGPRDIPHRFHIGPDGAHMLWVLTPGGFEALVEEASVPAAALTLPPADLGPPPNIEEIVRRHGNELLE
jgi:mannose-6-phosphate isomerase-like protein (cupin superfamily)